MKMRYQIFSAMVISGLLLACQSSHNDAASGSEPMQDTSWTGSMRQLKSSLEKLAPYIYDSKKFEAPENRDQLRREIQEMSQASRNLNHNPTLTHRDPTVRFVAAQFSQSLSRAHSAMQAGQVSYARYELMKVTSSCVQCHSRMQQGPEFHSFFFQDPFLDRLSLVDRSEYLIATRQFEKAEKVLLAAVKNPHIDASESRSLDRLTFLSLQLAVQYEQNPKMAKQVVDGVLKNPQASAFLKEKAMAWR